MPPISFPYRFRVMFLLCALATLTYLDRICISIVGVRMKEDLHLNNEQFGWVLAAFALAYAVFEIPSGMLGDRIGPRKIFIRIVLLWSLFTALTGMVNGLVGLLIVRFLFGIGESGTYPNAILVVSRWFPVKGNGQGIILGGTWFTDRGRYCSDYYCSDCSSLWMEGSFFCIRLHRSFMGDGLLLMVS